MPEVSDMILVRQYADYHSEPAFAELVRRHVNLVYSVALRRTGNAADAQDVAQAVFIILAQKAAGLRHRSVLTGWLYETTRFTSARLLRSRARQQTRDQEAHMQSTLNEPEPDGVWRQLAPHLEDAMTRLGERDRTLLALRFYENKSAPEAAAALGINEAAAHKRTSRALEKLRQFFTKRGIALSAAAIAGAVSVNSVQAAPPGLAQTISTVALAKGAAAGGSTLTLVKGALKVMAWTKAKTAIITGVVVVLAAGTTTVTVQKIRERQNEAWQLGPISERYLEHPPYRTMILPTRSAKRSPQEGNGGMVSYADGRVMAINASIEDLLRAAYTLTGSVSPCRTVVSTEISTNKYDFFSNWRAGAKDALQREAAKKFNLTGRFETTDTNVFLLKVKYPNARLKPNLAQGGSTSEGNGNISGNGATMEDLARALEDTCAVPVINQTGLTNRYDYKIHWKPHVPKVDDSGLDYQNIEGLKQALTDQLGLKLVPGTVPIEILFIEKAK